VVLTVDMPLCISQRTKDQHAALTEAAPTVVVQPAERDELVDLRGRWCEPPCHTTAREL
jgi:hypothetical protein